MIEHDLDLSEEYNQACERYLRAGEQYYYAEANGSVPEDVAEEFSAARISYREFLSI